MAAVTCSEIILRTPRASASASGGPGPLAAVPITGSNLILDSHCGLGLGQARATGRPEDPARHGDFGAKCSESNPGALLGGAAHAGHQHRTGGSSQPEGIQVFEESPSDAKERAALDFRGLQ
eukprot:2698103-Rhodomonas_salina.1